MPHKWLLLSKKHNCTYSSDCCSSGLFKLATLHLTMSSLQQNSWVSFLFGNTPKICMVSILTYCKRNWCVVWHHPQWRSMIGGRWPISAQQPEDSGQTQPTCTWWLPDPLTQTHTQMHTVCFQIPWNSLSLSLLCGALFSHSHLLVSWEEGGGEANVSLTWFLYSQRSLHTVSRLFTQRRGILSGLEAACCHLLIVLFR